MLKRLIAWIVNLFSKEPRKPEAASVSSPSPTSPAQAPVSFDFQWHRYKGENLSAAIIHLYARGFQGHLTAEQVEDARAAGVIIQPVPVHQDPAVDHSGFTLINQGYLINELTPGQSYTF